MSVSPHFSICQSYLQTIYLELFNPAQLFRYVVHRALIRGIVEIEAVIFHIRRKSIQRETLENQGKLFAEIVSCARGNRVTKLFNLII